MFALRVAGLVAAAVWFGGLVTLGVVAAPAVFEATGPLPEGRSFAGAIAAAMFRRFHLVSYACGAVLLGSLTLRAVLGPRPRGFGFRAALAAAILAVAVYSGLVVSGRIERLRQEIAAAPSSLPENDPRRVQFGDLHRQSTALHLAPLVGTLILLIAELRD